MIDLDANIILIDDNENDLDVSKEIIEKFSSAKINCYMNPNKALKEIASIKDDSLINKTLILLDINMPQISGLQVLASIKEMDKIKEIPVYIYSSSKRKEDVEKAYSLGAAKYLQKPLKLKDTEELFYSFLQALQNSK